MALPTITVIGNLKRIEMKVIPSGKAVTKFTVECAEKNAKGEWTNLYLDGECWEKQAEFVNQYFQDGSVAIVTGKLYTNVYEKADGTKVYQNKLLFPRVEFAPKDRSDAQPQQAPQGQVAQAYQPQNNGQQVEIVNTTIPAIDVDMDAIPF